ncbi:hypothetical protein [Pseudomonas rossensis]|uniref:hypothetical protein n=1 Tax=Pseudomonas rossensis TaxID=2305471 RepID=UPI00326168AE
MKMPIQPLSISTNYSANRSSDSIDSNPRPLSPAQRQSQEIINDILDVQNSAEPARFINRLPDHIATLQRLAEQDTFTTPRHIDEFAKSQGFATPLLPCTTSGSLGVRLVTVLELQEQLHSLQGQMKAMNGIHQRPDDVDPSLGMASKLISGYKYMLLLAVLSNVYAAGKLMLEHTPGRESNTVLGLAREVVALAIHLKLFGDMNSDLRVLGQIKNTRNSNLHDIPQLNLNDPVGSLTEALSKVEFMKQQSAALTKARDQAKDNLMKKDLPSVMAGFLTLALAGQFVSMAAQ